MATRFELVNEGFADLCLTTWPRHHVERVDPAHFWSGRRGSNSLPPPWQGGALPDELRPHAPCGAPASFNRRRGILYPTFAFLSTHNSAFSAKMQFALHYHAKHCIIRFEVHLRSPKCRTIRQEGAEESFWRNGAALGRFPIHPSWQGETSPWEWSHPRESYIKEFSPCTGSRKRSS